MPSKGPHISIGSEFLVERVLGIEPADFADWPEDVRELAILLAEELFLLRYNPFIDPGLVFISVQARFGEAKHALAEEYVSKLEQSIRGFWTTYQADKRFKELLIQRLSKRFASADIVTHANTLVECSTDATDLRMELPMMVVTPVSTEQIQFIVQLANELDFAIVPRGGGSGLTGGAIPAKRRSVILSLLKLRQILDVDPKSMVLCAQAGVITIDAIKAAGEQGLLFTVDPASKAASSLGGNISENSGGPFAFEYGTTIDNILSYRMVTPTGELIEVRRKDHPWHKILPGEKVVFEVWKVATENGGSRFRRAKEQRPEMELKEVIELTGDDIRRPGLGKDVTNKYLGGLPGIQKEGVDGIITEACFTSYSKPQYSRTLCLEFFGRSMHTAMLVIKDLVALRNTIRREGDLVKMSALEEFGIKYVQAIDYKKKSMQYEGHPISVLLIQIDSDHEDALEAAATAIQNIVDPYENVDVFAARDTREAEIFWEDRHKLSAISKRTSGFKINEDVVIPLEVIPEFADFLEELNLTCLAKAYRLALHRVGQLPWVAVDDEFVAMERDFTAKILKGEVRTESLNDQELEIQIFYFFQDLRNRYPGLKAELDKIFEDMQATRIVIANHMHAGDGNCHVNLPVNSNDPKMLRAAESAAEAVFAKVLELKGAVTGEHGIGITKIAFLSDEKLNAIKEFKKIVDPRDVLNPGKLTQRDPLVKPYTFSFNRLIQDIRKSGLPEKERLVNLLTHIQICTRCGKCRQVCPMYHPEQSLLFHPRNKNISLGAIIEAIYYSQINRGVPDKRLLDELQRLMEHCTGCGKCKSVCPVKIDTPDVMLNLRSFLEDKEAGGHPFKTKILRYLARDPATRVPLAAKAASIGQSVQNKALGLIPSRWRQRFQHPLIAGPGPVTGYVNLAETLALDRGSIFLPAPRQSGRREAVFYFPGCGAGLFFRSIGLAGLTLILRAGMGVAIPREHLCCGYPLLVSGCEEAFTTNQARNLFAFKKLIDEAKAENVFLRTVLTACGSCRDGLEHYELDLALREKLRHLDVVQYLCEIMPLLPPDPSANDRELLYHASCHAEWTGMPAAKAPEEYRRNLAGYTGRPVRLSPLCCGESGLGALTSPEIYEKLRARKEEQLGKDLGGYGAVDPILVGCPSCKVGITRSLLRMKRQQPVLHTLEFLAARLYGATWQEQAIEALTRGIVSGSPVRYVDFAGR